MSTLAGSSATMQVPQAARCMTATATFKPTEAVIRETYAAFDASLPRVQNVMGISWAPNLEPLPPQIYTRGGADIKRVGPDERERAFARRVPGLGGPVGTTPKMSRCTPRPAR
ncbi:hypothetical protein F5B21DRAFT_484199 [Xylaria acuta]|nr:hypothetical protein F5B21DRAFT_484199 [Xylaria acuta]